MDDQDVFHVVPPLGTAYSAVQVVGIVCDPDAFEEQADCRLCGGTGRVAVPVGLRRYGGPTTYRCPECRSRSEARTYGSSLS